VWFSDIAFGNDREVEAAFHSQMPCLAATGGKVVVTSTINRSDGLFYDIWFSAIDGTNGFRPIKLSYEVHPDRDESFKNEQVKYIGPERFLRDYECKFEYEP
jgi:hypothetical protein